MHALVYIHIYIYSHPSMQSYIQCSYVVIFHSIIDKSSPKDALAVAKKLVEAGVCTCI